MKLLLFLTLLISMPSAFADSFFGGGAGGSVSITASRAAVSDGSGNITAATTTATEIGYVNGVTSAIQTQINTKAPTAAPTFTGVATFAAGTAAAPSIVGTGAGTSGMFFDGTTPCISRSGQTGACFSNSASYFALPSGQAQYGMYFESGHLYVRGTSGTDSRIKTKMGLTTFAGGETFANVGGVRYKSTTAAGNVGTGEDDLQSVSLIGNALGTNGEAVIIESNGTFAANGNNKQVKLYFGSTVVADSGIVTINNGSYRCRAEVTRTAATTQIANGMCWLSDGTHTITVSNPTQTLSSATTVKATAEATDNDDISSKLFKVNYEPYGN